MAARGDVSGDENFQVLESSSNDQSGRQHRMNGGLWKQLQEKRGTTVFGEKLFSKNPRLVLRITMPKD